ncbi:Asp/Glu/hydantoin racemase [soil metagenome]
MNGPRIGLIAPCDLTLDHEYPKYITDGSSVHVTRTGYHRGGLTREFIEGVASPAEVVYATRSLVKINPEVVTFACTSGSFIHGTAGERRLRTLIEEAGAQTAQTTSGSLLDAVAAMDIEAIGIATPYQASVGELLADFLEEEGIRVLTRHHEELPDVIDPVTDTQVSEMVAGASAGKPDAVFLACTGVPTIQQVPALEAEFGLPILTANQVTMSAAANVAGADLAPLGHLLFGYPWQPK